MLLAALVWAGEAPPDPASVATAEMEASLARSPDIYLLLDPARRVLEVKARGVILDSVSLAGIEIVSQQPLLRRSQVEPPPLPALWTIEQGPGDTDREIIAPDSLRPYGSDEPEQPAESQPEVSATRGPAPTPTPVPEPPVSYRSQLDNGWDLWITERLPSQGLIGRAWAAVVDGLARLRGQGKDLPTAVTLAVAREDAQRIHHLLRTGTPLLVTAGSS